MLTSTKVTVPLIPTKVSISYVSIASSNLLRQSQVCLTIFKGENDFDEPIAYKLFYTANVGTGSVCKLLWLQHIGDQNVLLMVKFNECVERYSFCY